ncbi:hypothetical protein Tco_0281285 [Tanacetum coccineum]
MVRVPIHQDTSSVPPMTYPVIDLTVSHPVFITIHAPLPTSTTTVTATITTTSLPPPQPQQSTEDPMLLKHIGELEQHMADLIQDNLALEERLDKHGTRLYNLENLNIPYKVSQAVDEIVTDADILQQRMFEDNSYKAHDIHNDLYETLQKSLELDYSNQRLADQEEARKMKRKNRESPRTPPGCLCLLLLYLLVHQDLLSNKAIRLQAHPRLQPPHINPWLRPCLTLDTSQLVHLSNDEDSGNDHLPKDNVRTDWWKPLPEEERPATPEPTRIIPSSNVPDVKNNWASALVSTYEPPAENSLLAKTGDITTFINWYCRQFQMEECHKILTDQVDRTNPEGDQVKIDVNQPLPLGGPPGHKFYINKHDSPSHRKDVRTHMRILSVVRIKAYSRYGYDYLSEIVLRRADFQEHTIAKKDFKNLYPSDFEDLNLLLLQGHLDHLPGSDKRMLSTAVKLWTRNLVIRQRVEDFQLGIESYQTQLNLTKPGWDATGYEFKHDYTIIESPRAVVFPVNNNERKIMRFNEIYKFSDGTLTRILEALDYRVKEFKVKRLNPGMNTRFWTEKDVTRSKEFIAAIERRLKTRRIYRNLECFVGGRVRDIDYRLLQRTE